MLIKHKKIFECFNFFWKVFCFENFQKFQKLCNSVLATLPFGNSLAGQGPSHEKDLKNFQNFGFLGFSQLNLATGSRVETPVVSFTQNV